MLTFSRGLVSLLVIAAPSLALAQRPAQPPVPPAAAAAAVSIGMNDQVAMAVEESMNAHMDGPHLDLTPVRRASPGDSARAAKLVEELRRGIAKYRDVAVAMADGYHMFAPQVREQPIYH